jgi:hypothetical protein
MKNIFTEHPNSVGESYFVHLKFSCYFGLNMIAASLACLIHGIFPFLFKSTGSSILIKMMHRFVDRKPMLEDKLAGLFSVMEGKKANSAD